MCRGERVVREGIAETSITIYYCQFSIHCRCIVLGGVVLSVGMNRDSFAVSDWLAVDVVCEVWAGFRRILEVA